MSTIFPDKALSIRQPWCHHILVNGKPVENRSRRTHYRGFVLIHASMKVEDKDYCEQHNLKTGGIVGMVEIVDCVEQMDTPWWIGPYGWVLRNPIPLEFIPCKGKLSFFRPEIDFSALKVAA